MTSGSAGSPPTGRWTFLTNHARVLIEIAKNPEVRLRDVAATVGITERAVQAIVADLEAAGYLTRDRVGRRNRYTIDATRSFRHPVEAAHPIEDLINLFTHRDRSTTGANAPGGHPRELGAEALAPDPAAGTLPMDTAAGGMPRGDDAAPP
ncbi:DNA-binding MarR family transcriptional regulator [Thermocatellispora tengchongensis]|uniref:DNA-binding MarR family transcriptional regulator n=1 Tax=Thermocatellispora tengchongensis TaxID=1073253 RepID=A0A840NXG0_9ACTN|nr:winged helix-turn-helix domain-containing protein [Thermocatellispora tengchongensis]MBB5131469.1 DNA-binding MarR family transcriptional regulator [Thermocatellispora tengchongensis]